MTIIIKSIVVIILSGNTRILAPTTYSNHVLYSSLGIEAPCEIVHAEKYRAFFQVKLCNEKILFVSLHIILTMV